MAVITHRDLFAPSFYRVWNDVLAKKYPEIWLAGGRGCVSGDTLLETPNGKIAIRDFQGGEVISSVDGLPKACPACRPQRHSIQKLYRVLSENGYDISVTDEHLFLVPGNNWKMTRELSVGDPICTVDSFGLIVESKVKSIEYDKTDYYYDLNVDGSHNYIAHGFVNHNSTKSSFISTAIILLMEANPSVHCVCFRKYAANLADSVYSQFEFTINQKLRPLAPHWVFKKSPLKIVNVNTGQQIIFRGLDDPQKVKSLKAPFGYFGLTWFEELAEFDGIEEVRNVNQALHRGGHYFQTFCSYNPPETSSNWVNYEASVPQIVDGQLYRKVYRSDYRSVPVEWLGKNFFIEAELLKNTNERAYRHEYLGEVTGNGGSIFPNVKAMTMTDEMIAQFDHRHFGLDFGFAIDPAAWIALHYDKTRRTVYIYDEIYDVNLTNMDLAKLIKQKDMGFEYLMCDSAEPKSIAELEALGVNALPAQKGPDSVRFSIRFLQSLCHIYIDPIRCPNAFREFSQYEYEKNKAGQFISKYPDRNNHTCDSTRYALMDEAINAGLF